MDKKELITWKVWGRNLPLLYINGKNFDEVLAQARTINPNYNTAQLWNKGGVK